MLEAVVVAVAWPAGAGVEALSRTFWIHQSVSAIATLLLLRWIATVAGRSTRDSSAKVIPFRPLRTPGRRA
jgi:hypothetical protein